MKIIKILLVILAIIVILIILGIFLLKLILGVPSLKMSIKKQISNYSENYLTQKYGEHKFNVTKIEYDFHMTKLFDYSNPVGYMVYFKSDITNLSYISIEGLEIDKLKVKNDSLIEDYYFPNLDGYERYDAIKNIIPTKKIEDNLFSKLKVNFESNCISLKCNNIRLNIPDNIGMVPTMEELKNNIEYYEILDFNFGLPYNIENEEYKNNLNEYLIQNLGGNWDIYFNPNNSITCIKSLN